MRDIQLRMQAAPRADNRHSALADPGRAASTLTQLANNGVQIAIDDFGTGYSSLAYVRNLPASFLKIDRAFVSGLPDGSRDRVIVASTVNLAHELGCEP